ncbi:MAG: 1-acyl-sn-glycerol-3-phosphate acyltransferase [Myxococcota bacterium]|nr:1-acyl-sn-glycerol-3-phosphate acyltransferase [Myxococcota bacterium]
MSRFYHFTVSTLRFIVRRYFREVEVIGLEHLPEDGGGMLVSWHPNGMIDPGLILTHFPRQVIFGARDGLFRWPGLGWMMKKMGAVPIYRAMDQQRADPEARRKANNKSLNALASAVAQGRYSCLFPEGDSHDSPNLLDLKTGAARFYYQARTLKAEGSEDPVIIPVGLHYDAKRTFRSSVLIAFHPPISLSEYLGSLPEPDEPPQLLKERYRALTTEIERVLREVVHATESWDLHYLMHRVRKLSRAERGVRAGAELDKPMMAERTLGFARVWAGYYTRLESHPEQVAVLRSRLSEYDQDLRALGLEDHELDKPPRLASPWLAAILALQVVLVFFLLPPILLVGYIVNLPPALGLLVLSKKFSRRRKDESSIKLMFGVIAFPVTWLAAGIGAGLTHWWLHELFPRIPNTPALAGLVVVLLAIFGGMVALRYIRLARETGRAVRIRLTRARRRLALARLRVERSELYDAIMMLVGDLDLPGAVRPDGKVVSDEQNQRAKGWLK